jgi:hypothetical protein
MVAHTAFELTRSRGLVRTGPLREAEAASATTHMMGDNPNVSAKIQAP